MSYRKAIESIDGWQEMTDAGVIAAAKAKSFLYVNSEKWSLLGVATIIGPDQVKPFIEFCESIGYGWIATQAAGAGLPIGDPAFNAQLLAIGDPRCNALAAAGRRYISPCERFGVAEDSAAIASALALLRLEERKKEIKKVGSGVYSDFIHRVDLYDGNGPEPELCANGG
jgi:hypothetical protein